MPRHRNPHGRSNRDRGAHQVLSRLYREKEFLRCWLGEDQHWTYRCGGGSGRIHQSGACAEDQADPAQPAFLQPNPDIDFANSPFYVNTELREWKPGESPRRAGVSSFGLGGTNAHVLLEEAPEQEPSPSTRPWNLLVWSAKTESAVEKMGTNLAEHLKGRPGDSMSDVAYTLQVGRRLFPHRRALVCRDAQDAISILEAGFARAGLLAGYREQEPGLSGFSFSRAGPAVRQHGQATLFA